MVVEKIMVGMTGVVIGLRVEGLPVQVERRREKWLVDLRQDLLVRILLFLSNIIVYPFPLETVPF